MYWAFKNVLLECETTKERIYRAFLPEFKLYKNENERLFLGKDPPPWKYRSFLFAFSLIPSPPLRANVLFEWSLILFNKNHQYYQRSLHTLINSCFKRSPRCSACCSLLLTSSKISDAFMLSRIASYFSSSYDCSTVTSTGPFVGSSCCFSCVV